MRILKKSEKLKIRGVTVCSIDKKKDFDIPTRTVYVENIPMWRHYLKVLFNLYGNVKFVEDNQKYQGHNWAFI